MKSPFGVRAIYSSVNLLRVSVGLPESLRCPFSNAIAPTHASTTYAAKRLPAEMPAAVAHRSTAVLTQSGTGMVLMCPPFPMRSTIAQCSSRRCKCVNSKSANSRRLRPQPSRTARIARSRLPLSVSDGGACQNRRASSAVSQFPSLTPNFFTPFTRRMPAASSGLSSPASAASYASRRTAASRPFIVPAARCQSSRAMRYRVTTVLQDDRRGSEQYHRMNSSMACRYPRFDSGDRRLFSTALLL